MPFTAFVLPEPGSYQDSCTDESLISERWQCASLISPKKNSSLHLFCPPYIVERSTFLGLSDYSFLIRFSSNILVMNPSWVHTYHFIVLAGT